MKAWHPVPRPKTGWEWLRSLHHVCHFQTREGPKVGRASNSELKRWLLNGAVRVNGQVLKWDEPMDFPVFSAVLFPKTEKVTLL
jgi:hypothetical protein